MDPHPGEDKACNALAGCIEDRRDKKRPEVRKKGSRDGKQDYTEEEAKVNADQSTIVALDQAELTVVPNSKICNGIKAENKGEDAGNLGQEILG